MVSPIRSTTQTSLGRNTLRTIEALGRRTDSKDPAVVQQAAQGLLSELFFKPLLAEMREFPLGRELGTGGQAETAFAPQLDQRLADTVAASQQTLVEQIVRKFDRQQTAAQAPGSTTTASSSATTTTSRSNA